MKILILGTVPNDLLNFRADLIKDILKKKTSEKNELKSLVAKLEKNVV